MREKASILNFQRAVARHFVHRQSIAEVFITDCVAVEGHGRFLVGAQWPRLHSFYRTCTGRFDTMLLAETLRQCAIYIAHTQYGVPVDYKFTMQDMRIESNLEMLVIGAEAPLCQTPLRHSYRRVFLREHGRDRNF